MDQRRARPRAVGPALGGFPRRGESTLSRAARLEKVIGRALAGVCLLFGLQTIPIALASEETMNRTWAWTFGLLLYAALVGTFAAGLAGRRIRLASAVLAASFLLILAMWPFEATNLSAVMPTEPWPWYLFNVATAAVAVAFSDIVGTGYTLLVATCYFLVRLTPAGGDAGVTRAFLDSGYAFVIGIAIVFIVGLLRRSAAGVDAAERAAVVRYAAATREHAIEVERMNVDALLHDSVLAALLAGSRASAPREHQYAAALARTAHDVISTNSGAARSERVPLSEMSARLSAICRELGIEADIVAEGLDDATVPGIVAEVFFAASLQALMNSVQHAGPGDVHRTVEAVWADDRLTVTLADDGVGFDATKPTNRLGIRGSIVERLESVRGTATVTSSPGHGTTVTLAWDSVRERGR